jgi:ribosomal protein S18 acetylase RimI-like enzyme
MSSEVTIRPYTQDDAAEWMRVHAMIMTISHAWNYAIQERPDYAGWPSTRLVAEVDGKMVGLTDVKYERAPGELCLGRDTLGGYVLEFGRLPEYAGLGIGEKLMAATKEDALLLGYNRLEYWSQDRGAQRFYRRVGMKEIGRHYRFRMRAPQAVTDLLSVGNIGVEYIYAVCLPEEWPLVREKYEVLEEHPLEPHLCVGFEVRF